MPKPFDIASTPQLHFGAGKRSVLPSLLKSYGTKVLLVTGRNSLTSADIGRELLDVLYDDFKVVHYSVSDEPTPSIVDQGVNLCSTSSPDVVLAIGGGSVLDAGKAISAMIPLKSPVKDYLEGVGTKIHPGSKVPFIAMPTTAGTGSEATRNAVISEVGEKGFKRSLRHIRFVPDVAVIDPELTLSCPPSVTAASGMDAFTQLLESFLSTNANAFTDALAVEGLRAVARSLIKVYQHPGDIMARSDMAYAAYLSGVTLANAGLGLVHGFASSVGGAYAIPHGLICSSTMYSANILTVKKLRSADGKSALSKIALAGQVMDGTSGLPEDYYIDYLLGFILQCRTTLNIPGLSSQGVTAEAVNSIAEKTDNKYNPIMLDAAEREEVLRMSL
jgi:alcohol dehydrogenase class IV